MGTVEWKTIQEFYKEHFGTDMWLIEMLANRDILLLCASGASNTTISTFLDIPVDEIQLVLKEAFEFAGWDVDLPINPYKEVQAYGNFDREDLCKYPELKDIDQQELYNLCLTMKDIEERLDNEWI